MHEITAEVGEAHYGKARVSYAEQTPNIGLQIHTNMNIAVLGGHACASRFSFTKYLPGRMDHILVDRNKHCYQVQQKDTSPENKYTVKRYLCHKYETLDDLNLNWADAGIYKVVGVAPKVTKVHINDIRGRGIMDQQQRLYIWTEDMHDM